MMDEVSWLGMRRQAGQSRRCPAVPARIRVAAEGVGRLPETATPPIELVVESTDAMGEPAPWLEDDWWSVAIVRWGDIPVTVHIAPTPGALLHPVVLHHVSMLRRVVPAWRVIGHVYRDDVSNDEEVGKLARSLYHEVRFVDARRPGERTVHRCAMTGGLDELFARTKRAQGLAGVRRPALVRLPAPNAEPPESCATADDTAVRAVCESRSKKALSEPRP